VTVHSLRRYTSPGGRNRFLFFQAFTNNAPSLLNYGGRLRVTQNSAAMLSGILPHSRETENPSNHD
jgi:hypothetical protein